MSAQALNCDIGISLGDFLVNLRSERMLLQLNRFLLTSSMSNPFLFSLETSFKVFTEVSFVALCILRLG
jgi:hypothetical protein